MLSEDKEKKRMRIVALVILLLSIGTIFIPMPIVFRIVIPVLGIAAAFVIAVLSAINVQ